MTTNKKKLSFFIIEILSCYMLIMLHSGLSRAILKNTYENDNKNSRI